jgi:hypothetical protein
MGDDGHLTFTRAGQPISACLESAECAGATGFDNKKDMAQATSRCGGKLNQYNATWWLWWATNRWCTATPAPRAPLLLRLPAGVKRRGPIFLFHSFISCLFRV